MHRAAIVIVACGLSALAASNLGAPVIGMARDSQKRLRFLHGVAGNFVLGAEIGGPVKTWAFAGSGGFANTETEILHLDAAGVPARSTPAPGGDALFAPGSAHSASLYFLSETGQLWQAGAREDRRSPIEAAAIGGEVLAIASPNLRQAELAVCRASHLWLLTIDLHAGSVIRETTVGGAIGESACQPLRPGALLILHGRLVLATAQDLILQSVDGVEHRIPLSGAGAGQRIHQVGEDWVEIERTGHGPLLLRLLGDSGEVYRMPARAARP